MRRICRTVGLLWCLLSVAHAQEYATVEPRELVKNPQRYWARGIVFKDVLVGKPEGSPFRLGERRVQRFTTEAIGRCYVDAQLAPALRDMALEREYLFSGTVYQYRREYYVVVQSIMATMKDLTDLPTALERLRLRNTNTADAVTLNKLDQIQTRIQADLLAFATENNIEIATMFEPGSPYRQKLRAIIYDNISRMEQEDKAPATEFFVNLVAAVMAQGFLGEPTAEEIHGEEDVAPFPAATEPPPEEKQIIEEPPPAEPEETIIEDRPIVDEMPAEPQVEQPVAEPVLLDVPAEPSPPAPEVIEPPTPEPEAQPEQLEPPVVEEPPTIDEPAERPEEEEDEESAIFIPLRASPPVPRLDMTPRREAVIHVVKTAKIDPAAAVPARIKPEEPAPEPAPAATRSDEVDISELARRPVRWR